MFLLNEEVKHSPLQCSYLVLDNSRILASQKGNDQYALISHDAFLAY